MNIAKSNTHKNHVFKNIKICKKGFAFIPQWGMTINVRSAWRKTHEAYHHNKVGNHRSPEQKEKPHN